MEQKNDGLLPCQKETALENIESSMNLYDMPEHQDTLAVEGWALSELVDEVKRWRATHSAGEFSPDYCAASEALAEHLEHCTRPTPAPLSKGDEVMKEIISAAWQHVQDLDVAICNGAREEGIGKIHCGILLKKSCSAAMQLHSLMVKLGMTKGYDGT